jgi:hypothetical protein
LLFYGLLLAGSFQHPLPGAQFFLRQVEVGR